MGSGRVEVATSPGSFPPNGCGASLGAGGGADSGVVRRGLAKVSPAPEGFRGISAAARPTPAPEGRTPGAPFLQGFHWIRVRPPMSLPESVLDPRMVIARFAPPS